MPILCLRRCATRFLYFAAIVHKKGFCLLDEIILRGEVRFKEIIFSLI